MQHVLSSNISALDHCAREEELTVYFHNGRVYSYLNVSAEEYADLLAAPSVGRAFQRISGQPDVYPYARVE